MDYAIAVAVRICLYTILACSFNLVLGYTGLFSLAHAAFYGIGAYAAGVANVKFGLPFIPGLLLAMVLAGMCSLIISLPSLRISGDYLVVASYGFQFLVFAFFSNFTWLTKGPAGLPGIRKPNLLGWVADTPPKFLLLALIIALLCIVIAWRIGNSPFGRLLKGIREDEAATQALGKNVVKTKILVFTVAGMMAGAAGALLAHHTSYINPDMFLLDESIYILAMVLIGGAGSIPGSVVGAVVLVLIPEALRFTKLPSVVVGQVRQILYAAMLLGFLVFRPQGLLGENSRALKGLSAAIRRIFGRPDQDVKA